MSSQHPKLINEMRGSGSTAANRNGTKKSNESVKTITIDYANDGGTETNQQLPYSSIQILCRGCCAGLDRVRCDFQILCFIFILQRH